MSKGPFCGRRGSRQMNRAYRDRILTELGNEDGKVNNRHLFLVKNLEKHPDKQYWVPVPGTVIAMFLSGDHEWKYLGPAGSKAVKAKLEEIDRAQTHIVGPQQVEVIDDYRVDLPLNELGLTPPELKKTPKSNNKPEDLAS